MSLFCFAVLWFCVFAFCGLCFVFLRFVFLRFVFCGFVVLWFCVARKWLMLSGLVVFCSPAVLPGNGSLIT